MVIASYSVRLTTSLYEISIKVCGLSVNPTQKSNVDRVLTPSKNNDRQ